MSGRKSTPEALTQLTTATYARRLQVFCHEADALSTRIAADCERMLRLAHHADRAAWREAIGQAFLASRQAAALAQAPMATDEGAAERQLGELDQSVRATLQKVVDAMAVIIRTVAVTIDDELLVADAHAVRGMAIAAQSVSTRGSGVMPAIDTTAFLTARAASARDPDGAAHILAVDDSPQILKTLERMLSRLGHRVEVALNGREALEMARGTAFDLILTDIEMPEMNGMELLRELKASSALQHIPVIVVSSLSDVERVVESIRLGADDHLGKPFQQALLEARVRSSLLRKRMRDVELDHLRRVGQIAAAAEAVDRAVYVPGSLAPVARGNDQLAHLARVFERMVMNMKSREDRLNQRLRRLRSEMGSVTASEATEAKPSDASPFSSGQILAGRYRIRSVIGKGGMGIVYHAEDLELHEDVAVKIVRSDLVAEDRTLVDRLKSEIRLARRLSHTNILRAHDLGEFRDTYFITMEYVRGVSLLEMLDQRGRVTPDSAIAIGTQLADALAVAHGANIIHRDIKPANLIMDERGVLKVMDFGLAKVVKSETGHTLRGVAVGTPQYMAPEQLMGGDVDARSDLFAAGIVLYECLTGRTPFEADSPVALVSQMIEGEYPPISAAVPNVPPSLEAIIGQLLLLQPEARIQTASELSHRLGEIEAAGTS